MTDELREFHDEFFQEVLRAADSAGTPTPDAFFEAFATHLVDSGELRTADYAHYAGRGVRVDGYGGDPTDAGGELTLVVADFSQSPTISTLTGTEMDAHFKRLLGFLSKCLDRGFRGGLEETSAAFGVADLVHSSWADVQRVKLVLVTNRVLSSRIDGRPSGEVDRRPVIYSVWDIGRLQRYCSSGREREDLVINMADYGGMLPALSAHLDGAGYEAYLAVINGSHLAAIYERWGARLLEQNVRVFLQARGEVNKGIKRTIDEDPSMFFAYNNGITATAESVETEVGRSGMMITSFKNLQIVNGGQTTASISAATRRAGADVSKVFVQMKLSIIPHERAREVVPKISQYANSQNKVNAADFFANHPFHVKMKQFADTTFFSAAEGSFKQSKWFYERARGEYQDARANLTGKAKKEFDSHYPRSQIFTKTDLAKFLSSWDGYPNLVSKGAQTNFAFFAERLGKAWEIDADVFNKLFFEESVAKALIFRETERIVSGAPWYEGAYRANIVTYAIAKLAYDVQRIGKRVNLASVSQKQSLSDAFQAALLVSATAVVRVITSPPMGAVKNITEWAKRPGCWTAVQDLQVTWPLAFRGELISLEDNRALQKSAKQDQKVLNGIDAQVAVSKAGCDFWRLAKKWGVERKLLSIKEAEILDVAIRTPHALLSERQAQVLMSMLPKLREDGFSHVMPGQAAG